MQRSAIAWPPVAVDAAKPATAASIVRSSAASCCFIVTAATAVGTADGRSSSHTTTAANWHCSNSLWMVENYLLP